MAFFAVPSCLFAQYAIGIKASPFIFGSWNYATGNINDNTFVSGFYSGFSWAPVNAGAFFSYTFRDNFAIQTEIKPMVEGFSCTITDSDINGGLFTFTYIETPLLFQYKREIRFPGFAESGLALKFFVEAGLAPKFLVEANHGYYVRRYDGDVFLYEDEEQYDARSYFNKVVLKGNAGGGIMLDFAEHFTLIIDTRLGYDFTPIGKKSVVERMGKVWSFDNVRLLHFTIISFGIAYRF